MPKSAKERSSTKDAKAQKIIPPDVFDDTKGVKVFISEEENDERDNGKKDIQLTVPEGHINDENKKNLYEDEGEDSIEASETDDKIEVSVKIEKKHKLQEVKEGEGKNKEFVFEKEEDSDSSEKIVSTAEDEDSIDSYDNSKNASFYEKVLGEKPPDGNSSDNESEIEQKEGINRSLFFLGGIVFVMTIIIATGVGLIVFKKTDLIKKINITAKPTVTPRISPTSSPTPTPKGIDKSDITFQVLNGSGESGKAGKTADLIKELGYTIDDVGNADTSDYSGFSVGFSKDLGEESKKAILADLKKEFVSVNEDTDLLPDGVDVLVVIGK